MVPIVSDMTLTDHSFPIIFDDWVPNESSYPSPPRFFQHPRPLDSHSSFSREFLEPESSAALLRSMAQAGLGFCNSGNGHGIPTGFMQDQDAGNTYVPLDPGVCHPFPIFATPYTPPELHSPPVGDMPHAPFPHLTGGSNIFSETAAHYKTLTFDMASKPQAILHAQQSPAWISGLTSSTVCCDKNHGAKPHLALPKNNLLASVSSGKFPGDCGNVASDKEQPPVVLHRSPETKASYRRRYLRVCAISIEGLWIDREDLYSGVGQSSSGTICVHECQWAKSSDPCGMWVIGSRSSVGAHIRKWHTQSYTNSGASATCLWHSCTISKAMLKDSINRHVVTVHLEESFCCCGCNQKFSRKDVYDKHVRKVESCRGAGAAMVYGAESRVIDTRQALLLGGAVRYVN